MKRSTPLRRVPFKRSQPLGPGRDAKILGREGALLLIEETVATGPGTPYWTLPLRRGTYAGATSGVELTRSTPLRNRRLLDLAQGRRCLLSVPGVCTNDCRTVVACHSNWYDHGKAGARKADDCWTVWGCSACHRWLDQGRARIAEKRHVFDCAHANQVWWWGCIAADATEKDADRRAAQWALDHLRTP